MACQLARLFWCYSFGPVTLSASHSGWTCTVRYRVLSDRHTHTHIYEWATPSCICWPALQIVPQPLRTNTQPSRTDQTSLTLWNFDTMLKCGDQNAEVTTNPVLFCVKRDGSYTLHLQLEEQFIRKQCFAY